jgi:hypothetical protein
MVVGGTEVGDDVSFGGVIDRKMCGIWSHASFLSFIAENPENS